MYNIVIVEDEPTVRRGLVMTTPWDKLDCKVIGDVANGEEGKDIILKLKPDIVITDIKMPKKDGMQMIEEVSEDVDTVFIVLTAFSDFNYAKNAIKLGVVDYLVKPFEDEGLVDALESAKRSVDRIRIVQSHGQSTQKDIALNLENSLKQTKHSNHENINRVVEYIRTCYAQDINIADTADKLGVSASYLARLFKEEMDYSFHEYLVLYRIQKACEMLFDPNIRIYEVATACGFNDQRYFSIVFKKHIGVTPGHYKEKLPK